jgi:CubicO group peptidase (beta-lactamase class C family)
MLMAAVALYFQACGINSVGGGGGTSSNTASLQTFPWPLSTPAAQGMDTIRLAEGLRQIQNNTFVFAFLVVRNDLLVVEYYSNGFVKENDFDLSAASTSVTSALTGIALDQRILPSTQEKILRYFPEFDTTHSDPRKQIWTLEQFLEMRSGIAWNESDDHSNLFNSHTNWLSTSLGLPLASAPGDSFVVTTPNANILSAILTRTTGMSTSKFAETFLSDPLSISVRSWATDPQAIVLGGSGIRLTPRDFARFGQLYLHNGAIDGKQIISRQWIQQSLAPRNPRGIPRGSFSSVNFGYSWWTTSSGSDSLFMTLGFAGKAMYVIPTKNMIIVTITDGEVTRLQGDANEQTMMDIVRRYFL